LNDPEKMGEGGWRMMEIVKVLKGHKNDLWTVGSMKTSDIA
jgi:hypothetical protein